MSRTFVTALLVAVSQLGLWQNPALGVDVAALKKPGDPCAHQAQHFLDDCCIGGFLDGRTLVILPDRVMVPLAEGQSYKGVRLVGLDATGVLLDYRGSERRIEMGTAWQLEPQKDISWWFKHYQKQCLRRIENEHPYVAQKGHFIVRQNGSVRQSDMMQVRRASPLGPLPEFMESAEFVVLMNPPRPTKLSIKTMKVTTDAYRRLALSTAASMWCH